MFERPGLPADRVPSPFPNDKAAAAANNGAVPPDLSLMAKARNGGADLPLHGLLTGYAEPPDDLEAAGGQNYNHYFPGNMTAMAPPLFEDAVEYADGTAATVEQMASDMSRPSWHVGRRAGDGRPQAHGHQGHPLPAGLHGPALRG